MKPVTSTARFATALLVALLCVSLIEIYVFAHFEGALGSRFDNLELSALVDAAISLIAAFGFAAALYWRRSRTLPIRNARIWSPVSGGIACGLIYAIAPMSARLSELFGSWQIHIGFVAAYCLFCWRVTCHFLDLGAQPICYLTSPGTRASCWAAHPRISGEVRL